MGRRYYCDYCEKTMVNNPAAIKTHNEGLQHQKLKKEHFQKFKKIEAVIEEESKKIPCRTFHSGKDCMFGMNCRFSHYTKEQMDQMNYYVHKKHVESLSSQSSDLGTWFFSRRKRNLKDSKHLKQIFLHSFIQNGNTDISEIMSWKQPAINIPEYALPPSVRRISLKDFKNFQTEEWG